MLIVKNSNTKPEFNLALEEYLLKNKTEDIFMLWRNEPAIIVGRNQNALEEINIDCVKENNIHVIRRLTGGGAVFHDLGNINFTFIESQKEKSFNNYEMFTKPIINFLNTLGVPAVFSGRNDLLINGMKFSGNAQTVYKNRIMHHGTLLFKANMSKLSEALKVNPLKIQSKGIKSIRSRVTNISEYLPQMEVEEFIERLQKYIIKTSVNVDMYNLKDEDITNTNELVRVKYGTWEWNFGTSPEYNFKKSMRFNCGIVEVFMTVTEGIIKSIVISGDFFGSREIAELEKMLCDKPHNDEIIRNIVSKFNLSDYISGITVDEFIGIMF